MTKVEKYHKSNDQKNLLDRYNASKVTKVEPVTTEEYGLSKAEDIVPCSAPM